MVLGTFKLITVIVSANLIYFQYEVLFPPFMHIQLNLKHSFPWFLFYRICLLYLILAFLSPSFSKIFRLLNSFYRIDLDFIFIFYPNQDFLILVKQNINTSYVLHLLMCLILLLPLYIFYLTYFFIFLHYLQI